MPAGQSSGTSAVAIVGAVTGGIALVWNIWRSAREGARLRVNFYVYEIDTPDEKSPAADISIANAGTLPAYVSDVRLTEHLPWMGRVPLVRSLSFRTMNRWWLRWLSNRYVLSQLRIETDHDLTGRIEPGEMKDARFMVKLMTTTFGSEADDGDEWHEEVQPMTAAKVERIAATRQWAVVETGLRRYTARVVDNRERHDKRKRIVPDE
jgi:hypothetical protein